MNYINYGDRIRRLRKENIDGTAKVRQAFKTFEGDQTGIPIEILADKNNTYLVCNGVEIFWASYDSEGFYDWGSWCTGKPSKDMFHEMMRAATVHLSQYEPETMTSLFRKR